MDTFLDSNSHNVACANASVWQPSEYWVYGDRRVSATRLTFDATRRVSRRRKSMSETLTQDQVASYQTAIIRCLVRQITAPDSHTRDVTEAYECACHCLGFPSSQGQLASMNDHIMSALGGETTDESYE